MAFHRNPTTFVSHIHLKVSNIEQSVVFYRDVLGFQALEQTTSMVIFSADGKSPLFTIEQPKNAIKRIPRQTGLFHVAFLLPNRSDLATILRHLLQQNYPLQGASDHLVSEAIYLADPDGNGIEIYIDRDSDQWNWHKEEVEMGSDALDVEDLMQMATASNWSAMPAETIIGHIHLQVNDLTKAEHFYINCMPFALVNRYGNQALFVSSGGYHHHIGLNTWNSLGGTVPKENSIGLKNYTLSMSLYERERTVNRLRANQIKISQDGDMYVVQDPSGTHIYF